MADDFRKYAPALQSVNVTQINPDDASVLATSYQVTALKRVRRIQTVDVTGGEIGAQRVKFWLIAEEVDFEPYERCRITEEDGTIWSIGTVQVVALGAFYVCDECVKIRT